MLRRLATTAAAAGASLAAARPDADLVGSPSVNPLSDGCWTNTSLSAMGKRALVVTTSYGHRLPNGQRSGVAVEEFTAPYYVYQDAGMEVDIASIQGGDVPLGMSTPTPSQLKFRHDADLKSKLQNSRKIDDVDFSDYDLVFMAGGWGAAFDLGTSQVLGAKVAAALEARRPLVGSTCHGALGFALANKTDGSPWLRGMTATGVTTAQIQKLGIKDQTPMHPEEVLRRLGANYVSIVGHGLLGDVGATSVAIDTQGPVVVTGQNQNSACAAAQRQLLFFMDQQHVDVDTYALVPTADCEAPVKWCFNGFKSDIEQALKLDVFDLCRDSGHVAIQKGRCQDKGFDRVLNLPVVGPLVKDPLFRKLSIFFKHEESILV